MSPRVFSETDRLYFMHIPKTAGTSLKWMLKSYFAEGAFCPAIYYSELVDIPLHMFRQYRGFAGNFSYSFHWLFDEPLRMVTFLRDPVKHVLSHAAYAHFNKEHPYYPQAKSLSLLQILRDDALRRDLDNQQARQLAMDVNPVPLLEQARGQRQTGHGTVEDAMWEQALTMSDGEIVALAKAHLDQFDFVGLTERSTMSMYLLCKMLGWEPPARFPVSNVSGGRFSEDELTEEVRSLIQELVRMDTQVYEYAQEIFKHQLQENPEYVLALKEYLIEQLMIVTRNHDQLYAQLPGWAWTGVGRVRDGVAQLRRGVMWFWNQVE